jgi:TolB-like protein/tetratricopeptide (TPR) repeat protein
VTRIGRFVVRGELGRGGMGVVYRAEDPTLGRPVALKLLPAEAARTFHAREQLLAEARAAAVLDHPNICTVYEVGESAEGELYLAMALYEGQTLAERLAAGRMPLSEATDVAVQIAQGLEAAHAIGIVHRDIKPSNVMITRGGLVKILDFGIARATTDPAVTGPSILGTPLYMAPEQLNNVPDLDGRVDAWALGVILHEMLTGSPPFRGDTMQSLLKSILFDVPAAVAGGDDAAAGVGRLAAALLEKDRDRRLTLSEFRTRVRQPIDPPSTAEPPLKSLAVLPFHDLGGEADAAAFTDGLTAELIADLSRVPALRVTSWTSARRYRATSLGLREIARELDVHYVLEGSVRRAGRDLRITAQLIDATNDAEIWSDKYGGTIDDVFDMQARVSKAITSGLRVVLGDRAADRRPIADPLAYDLYLRARGEIWSFTTEGPARAIDRIDLASRMIGPNALLLATRATALWQLVNTGAKDLQTLAEAESTALGALALDPSSAPALRILALIRAMRGETAEAGELVARAVAASPENPETLSSAGLFYTLVGDGERAVRLSRRATEIDPFYALHWTALGFALASLGRHDETAAAARRAFEVDPRDLPTQAIAPLLLYERGEPGPAVERAMALPPPGDLSAGGYAALVHVTRAGLARDRARVEALVTPDVERFLSAGLHNALYAAEIACLVGDTRRALTWLERSAALGLGCYPLVAEHSFLLAPVRKEPGFPAVLEAVAANWHRRQSAADAGPTVAGDGRQSSFFAR